ncbi:hypothetical protein CGRA01v4_11845 [Colletotrichum graminicola]|uniref:AB hydrolase-1 domain-containing protein n=1 Tax=Colletotrichum graminicola (strain M1.001 / M2 / FGSC 10212) TaxID=645133 RepID=E3QC02_COLGM|nr:uncharacterized protein GLRG_03381 [Colletotrichum graminicola M1.001]EFQ28237.1 hypothetical protein GLRG_03381 [Colletotrichum graminicola M1.001]WDK20558.1 hypothetical protein CGRA01v4_11845 [Colletotrichum graminicola]
MASQEADGRSASPLPPDDPAGFLDDPRFHQTFTLPAGPDRPNPFQVTYCDYGYRDPENPEREHVLLICGPLMGSRFLHVVKDALAKQHHVRVINPDRPGFGGTTPVPAADRVRIWLEIVPALLHHLGVRHVSIVAHSGGTIYALNILLHQRHLLSPTHPYIALAAPWVHPSHSGVATMRAAAALPDAVLGRFHTLTGFFQRNVAPVTAFSGVGIRAVSDLLPSIWGANPAPAAATAASGVDSRLAAFEQAIWKRVIDKVFAGSVQGLSEEAVLLLKRAEHPGYWGSWEDHDQLVTLLAEKEAELGAGGPPADGARLKVDVYFAEEDHMIGTREGPRWFEDCWRAERRGDRIDFSSCVVSGADHDTIVDLEFDVFERIFRQVGWMDESGGGPPSSDAGPDPKGGGEAPVA